MNSLSGSGREIFMVCMTPTPDDLGILTCMASIINLCHAHTRWRFDGPQRYWSSCGTTHLDRTVFFNGGFVPNDPRELRRQRVHRHHPSVIRLRLRAHGLRSAFDQKLPVNE